LCGSQRLGEDSLFAFGLDLIGAERTTLLSISTVLSHFLFLVLLLRLIFLLILFAGFLYLCLAPRVALTARLAGLFGSTLDLSKTLFVTLFRLLLGFFALC
jgi:hypothetical protein